MKKLFYPFAFALTAFLILYSCSTEEEDTTPPPQVQQPTPEPEPEVSQFTLTVTAGEGGSVSTEGGTYDEGTEISVTATPDEGYEFVGWEGNSSTVQSLTITLNSNQSLSALFEQVQGDVITSSDGTATDQDGNTFGWINYKSQDWAIENAQVETYRDGTPIPQADIENWGLLTTGAWCYYDNDPTKGKLYNWYAVMGIHDNDPNTPNKEFAPEGWQIPNIEDWKVLRANLTKLGYFTGGYGKCNFWVAKSMASTSGWVSGGTNSNVSAGIEQNLNNRSGFNAFPVGWCSADDFPGFEQGEFIGEGEGTKFWSYGSTKTAELNNTNFELLVEGTAQREMFGLSVRFMRNLPKTPLDNGTAIDQDGNTFGWINYESQDWAIENAQVETYRDGTPIPQADIENWGLLTTGAWCYYDNDPSKGKLYNWYAVMGIHDNDPNTPNKEFAPEGWQIPNIEDWKVLRDYLIDNLYNYDLNLCNNKIAKSMASTSGWEGETAGVSMATPVREQNKNNRSGFNAYPVGLCSADDFPGLEQGEFMMEGEVAEFWSSTISIGDQEGLAGSSFTARLQGGSDSFQIEGTDQRNIFGLSVRFMRD